MGKLKIRKEVMDIAKKIEKRLRENEQYCKEKKFQKPLLERVELVTSYVNPEGSVWFPDDPVNRSVTSTKTRKYGYIYWRGM